MELEYTDYVEALRATALELATEIASFHGVEDVLQWMKRHGLMNTAIDLIGMDEFNYDFLIQLETNGRWLAFGVT